MSESYSTWPMKNISDIAQGIYGGGTPSREVPAFWDGGIPWVTPGELTRYGAKYLSDTVDTISQAGLMSSGARLLPANTVLVTSRATLGNVALAATETTTNQGFRSVILRSDQSPDYWYHYFTTLKPEMERKASGTTFLEISGREFAKLKVPVPPLPEQHHIAEILDALDDQIHFTEANLRKKYTIADAFIEDLLFNLRVDFPESTVGSVFEIKSGITLGPHRISRANPTPYLRVANVHRGSISYNDIADMETSPAEQQEYSLQQGDLLIVEGHADVGQIGRCARVVDDVPGLVYQNHLFRLRSRMNPVIAEALLNSQNARLYWRRMCSTSSGLHTINKRTLATMPIATVNPSEETRLASMILAARSTTNSGEKELAKLRTLKTALMADLLSGKVRVVDRNVGGG